MQSKYIFARIGQTILTLFVVLGILWVLFRALPGDPTAIYISGRLSQEDIDLLRKSFGLDEPIYRQFFKYIFNFLRGDFGISFHFREPVINVLKTHLANTFILMAPAMLAAFFGGVMIGSRLGMKRGTIKERIGVIFSLFVRSFPIYLSGIICLMVFAHYLGWFPLGGMRTIGLFSDSWLENSLDIAYHVILPLSVAALYFVGDIVVIARTSMLELLGEEFLEFAKGKGLGEKKVRKIAMRNALIPVITYSTVMIGFAFGGQVLLEIVFSWPGIGRLMVESVSRLDYPMAQASFFVMALAVILGNLVIDLFYGYLDPRITYEKL